MTKAAPCNIDGDIVVADGEILPCVLLFAGDNSEARPPYMRLIFFGYLSKLTAKLTAHAIAYKRR